MLKETTVNQLNMETKDCKIETQAGTPGDRIIKLYAVSTDNSEHKKQCNLQCKKGFFAAKGDAIVVECKPKDSRTSEEGDLTQLTACERA